MFPAEREPDTNRFAPHHFLVGNYLAGLSALLSGIELGAAPIVVLAGVLLGLFAWNHFWYDHRRYPAIGAAGSAAGLAVVTVGLFVDPLLLEYRLLAGVGVLVAADDCLQHALGVSTPLDTFWNRYVYPLLA